VVFTAEILRAVDLGTRVPELLRRHPSVRSVELVGSRARGSPTALSDWDFGVETDDLAALKPALPGLVAPLEPLAEQWDPLGEPPTYMLVVRGPVKIDLIFSHEAVPQRPPWRVGPDTLAALDAHFWDWILWLAAKRAGGRDELVRGELKKMHGFLLGPLAGDDRRGRRRLPLGRGRGRARTRDGGAAGTARRGAAGVGPLERALAGRSPPARLVRGDLFPDLLQ
jgi:hypothetical protein